MLYLFDFTSTKYCFYNRIEVDDSAPLTILLQDHQVYSTDPDWEGFALPVPQAMRQDYLQVSINDVVTGRYKIEPLKLNKHSIEIESWELYARLKKVHPEVFEFSISTGQTLYTPKFGWGEPLTE